MQIYMLVCTFVVRIQLYQVFLRRGVVLYINQSKTRSMCTRNSYTIVCLDVHVPGDNPRAIVSGLSPVHVDKHGITIFTTYISIDLTQYKIFRA